MARPPATEESWQTEAIDLMVRNGVTLRAATQQLNVMISQSDCENIQRRRSFQKALRDARNRYHLEVGADPGLTKASTIGRLSILASRLEGEDSFDKAAEVLFKLAKLAGWLAADASVNVFQGLTAKEYEEVRKKLTDVSRPSSSSTLLPV
jgi:hypothetical protein